MFWLRLRCELVEELEQKGVVLVCDVGKEKENAVKSTFESFEKIDILVNCAGIGDTNKAFEEIDSTLWVLDSYFKHLNTNYFGIMGINSLPVFLHFLHAY